MVEANKRLHVGLFIVVFGASVLPTWSAPWDGPVDPDYKHASPEAYERWRDLKYGLRIHWGQYCLLGVEASWPLRQMNNQDRQAYFNLYQKFNPTEFDAKEWMQLFERCGLKYFTITTKHCDGFSLWDTQTRVKRRVNYLAPGGPAIEECDLAYSIMEGPFKRDIIKELCDAAHRHNIAIDLYFSHCEWYDADFRSDPDHPFVDKNYNRQTDPAGYARMVQRHRQQIREILTRYGKIDMMCLDQDHSIGIEWPDMLETIKMARSLQPDLLIRKRGIGAYGDYMTPENWIPAAAEQGDQRVKMPWMVIHTLSGQFAYDPDGSKYRDGRWILEHLIDIVAKGGNFMVSIGPDGQGRFHPTAVKHLEYAGDWLQVNGPAIYATRPWTRYHEGDKVRFTRSKDGRTLYAICLDWPGTSYRSRLIKPVPGSTISLLGDYDEQGRPQALPWQWSEQEGLLVEIPQRLQDPAHRPCVQAYAFQVAILPTADAPVILPREGVHAESATVEIISQTPHATVHYTLDGSEPDEDSPAYAGPFKLKQTATIQARTFAPRMEPSSTATARLRIGLQPPAKPKDLTPGLTYKYYEGDWQCLPDFRALTPVSQGVAAGFDLDKRQREDHFALCFTGYLAAPVDGVYTFTLRSDNGSRLWIGDELVVDNDGLVDASADGQIGLQAGLHPVTVGFFESWGKQILEVYYEAPGLPRQRIPATAVFH